MAKMIKNFGVLELFGRKNIELEWGPLRVFKSPGGGFRIGLITVFPLHFGLARHCLDISKEEAEILITEIRKLQ